MIQDNSILDSIKNLSADKQIKVTLVKSLIGCKESHRASVKGLNLRGIGKSVIVNATPENIGMINKVRYLVKCEVL